MTYQTYESDARGRRRVYVQHDTFAAAWQALRERPNVVYAEIDQDNADCADALLSSGIVLSIEPA
jgi:hypothetical protein